MSVNTWLLIKLYLLKIFHNAVREARIWCAYSERATTFLQLFDLGIEAWSLPHSDRPNPFRKYAAIVHFSHVNNEFFSFFSLNFHRNVKTFQTSTQQKQYLHWVSFNLFGFKMFMLRMAHTRRVKWMLKTGCLNQR